MSLADRLLGVLGGGMVLAAAILLVFGGEGDGAVAAPTSAAPPLEMIEPRDGAVLDALDVVFRSGELTAGPGGLGIGEYHLHVELDGVELMPTAQDLEPLGDGTYRWRLSRARPGPHTLRLLWSGPDHRPLPETATEPVRVELTR